MLHPEQEWQKSWTRASVCSFLSFFISTAIRCQETFVLPFVVRIICDFRLPSSDCSPENECGRKTLPEPWAQVPGSILPARAIHFHPSRFNLHSWWIGDVNTEMISNKQLWKKPHSSRRACMGGLRGWRTSQLQGRVGPNTQLAYWLGCQRWNSSLSKMRCFRFSFQNFSFYQFNIFKSTHC